jgi:hypothetical protein
MHQRLRYARDSPAGRGRASENARYRLLTHMLAARLAAQRRALAPASRPAPVSPAPVCTHQSPRLDSLRQPGDQSGDPVEQEKQLK